RCCCSTSRRRPWMRPIARWSWGWSRRRNARALRWWRSCMTTTCARRSPIAPSMSQNSQPLHDKGPMRPTEADMILTNARVVLDDRVIERGWVAVAHRGIVEIGEGQAPERGEDFGGGLLMRGLIELHTDHLEAHYVPRPKVFWDPVAAVVSYDGQLATSGITPVLDSLRVWREDGAEDVDGQADILAAAIDKARHADLLRADHFLHLRCE